MEKYTRRQISEKGKLKKSSEWWKEEFGELKREE